MHLTTLPIGIRGWTRAPSVALGTTEIPNAGWLMLDYENDNGILEEGPRNERYADVIERATLELNRFRNLTRARIGWYGWPYPRNEEQAVTFAKHFGPIVRQADWLAPCCYAQHEPIEERYGELFALCVTAMQCKKRPRFGVVSDWMLDSSRAVTWAEAVRQCRAARAAGCGSLFVWSGVDYHVWAAKLNHSDNPTVMDTINRSRATLLGSWGFRISEWTEANIEREHVRVGAQIVGMFAQAWKETK